MESGGHGGGHEVNGNWRRRDGDDKNQMQVPERIIVTGAHEIHSFHKN